MISDVGGYRIVYQHPTVEGWVIKVARRNRSLPFEVNPGALHNKNEHFIWQTYKRFRIWLAPIIAISPSAGYVIQQKGVFDGTVPREIPDCIFDKRSDNWVWINGRIVCCDYGDDHTLARLKESGGKWQMVPS